MPMGRHVFNEVRVSQKPHGLSSCKKTTIKAYYDMVMFIHSLGLKEKEEAIRGM